MNPAFCSCTIVCLFQVKVTRAVLKLSMYRHYFTGSGSGLLPLVRIVKSYIISDSSFRWIIITSTYIKILSFPCTSCVLASARFILFQYVCSSSGDIYDNSRSEIKSIWKLIGRKAVMQFLKTMVILLLKGLTLGWWLTEIEVKSHNHQTTIKDPLCFIMPVIFSWATNDIV